MEHEKSQQRKAILFLGGDMTSPPPDIEGAFVVAADSGYDIAMGHRIPVDLLVGDLDSISNAGSEHARSNDVEIARHPQDKDETDFELAMAASVARGANAIDIYGGEGGAVDHFLGVATGISSRRWNGIQVRWHVGDAVISTVQPHQELRLDVPIGTNITILPVGDTSGVSATGV